MSDLHLDAGRPQLTEIFVHFLRKQARTADALYLLGDIFEYWIGDDDDNDLIVPVCHALREASDHGLSIFLMHGNRDFLIGHAFADRAGIDILDDPHQAILGGVPTLLTHGDRYCTSDARYVTFRKQVRDPAWQQTLLARSLADRRTLAIQLRKESEDSQHMQISAGEELSDVVESDVVAELMTMDAVRLIHGHTHRPAVHQIRLPDERMVERIVLSDWRATGEALWIGNDGSAARQVLAAPSMPERLI